MRFLLRWLSAISMAVLVALCGAVSLQAQDDPPATDDLPPGGTAREEPTRPLDLGTSERETVRLVLLDVMVLDRDGKPVPGLTIDDFDVVAAGRPVAIDTLDVSCRAAEGPDPTRIATTGEQPEVPRPPRRVAIVVDYQHLGQIQQADVYERAREMVRDGATGDTEIMLAALNGGLRIEQKFTSDPRELASSLKRMEYDVSLWAGKFDHLTERGFVDGMTTLLDVLGAVPGPKAVVLYSAMTDVPLDLEFQRIAAVASSSRCFIYPVRVGGLDISINSVHRPPGSG
jgi:VWFA-related protein